VGRDPKALSEYFRRRTLTPAVQEEIRTLIGRLGHQSYKVRHRASVGLIARGPLALPALRVVLGDTDLEIARRAERAVHRIIQDQKPAVTAAAVRLFVQKKGPAAMRTLLAFAPYAENDAVAEELLAILASLAAGNAKPDPALTNALADPNGIRRAMAAEVLCRAGRAERRSAVRKLLTDPDPEVRCRVALALGRAHDREAVLVLIDLLPRLPSAWAYRALDFLYEVAGEASPSVPLGKDEAGRRQSHQAWAAWWHRHGPRVDLARLGQRPRLRGYTMLVLLDRGRVVERDASGSERWQVGGLRLPLDAQMLPGERLLVAEHAANRVTERNLQGQVLWEVKVDGPLMAQRLDNGNTFTATRNELIELDRTGNEVSRLPAPPGEMIMRARKLSGGDIACVTTTSRGLCRFRLLDVAGQCRRNLTVSVATYGGRIEVLKQGHILVPELNQGRVAEYDAEGKVVWQVQVQQPVAAVRLADGHTLVTTYGQNRAIEFDAEGNEVAEFRAPTRVTRAWRR
jgi:hypothetical protein